MAGWKMFAGAEGRIFIPFLTSLLHLRHADAKLSDGFRGPGQEHGTMSSQGERRKETAPLQA